MSILDSRVLMASDFHNELDIECKKLYGHSFELQNVKLNIYSFWRSGKSINEVLAMIKEEQDS